MEKYGIDQGGRVSLVSSGRLHDVEQLRHLSLHDEWQGGCTSRDSAELGPPSSSSDDAYHLVRQRLEGRESTVHHQPPAGWQGVPPCDSPLGCMRTFQSHY